MQFENCNAASSPLTTAKAKDADQGQYLTQINDGDYWRYDGINMGSWLNSVELRYAADDADNAIELRLDAIDGKLCGKVQLENSGGQWKAITIGTSDYGTSGTHDLYVIYRGAGSCRFDWWQIEGSIDRKN